MAKPIDTFCGILKLKGQILGSLKDKYRYLFIPFNKEASPLLVYSKINRTKEAGEIVCQVRKEEHKKGDKYPSGTIILKIGSTESVNDVLTGLVYHYGLNNMLKMRTPPIVPDTLPDDTNLIDHTDLSIYSIDPEGCKDIDDAFSLQSTEDGCQLNIYIALVGDIYPEYVDFLNERTFTLYFSENQRYDMFGKAFTESRSLDPGATRIAVTLQIDLDKQYQPLQHRFFLAKIINKRAINYEEVDRLLAQGDKFWKTVLSVASALQTNTVHDDRSTPSHRLIETFMVTYNKLGAAKLIASNSVPILRVGGHSPSGPAHGASLRRQWRCPIAPSTRLLTPTSTPTPIPIEMTCRGGYGASPLATQRSPVGWTTWAVSPNFMKFLGTEAAIYQYYSENGTRIHEGLGIKDYSHLTSPLRRAVDVYNQWLLIKEIVQSDLNGHLLDLTVINERERRFKQYYRRVQLFQLYNKYSVTSTRTVIAYEDKSDDKYFMYECFWPEERLRVKLRYLKTTDSVSIDLFQPLQVQLGIIMINGLPRVKITT